MHNADLPIIIIAKYFQTDHFVSFFLIFESLIEHVVFPSLTPFDLISCNFES
jgi:hypothetical protein